MTILTALAIVALCIVVALVILAIFVCLATDSDIPLADLHDNDVLPAARRGWKCTQCGDWPMSSSMIQPDYFVFTCDSCGFCCDESGEPYAVPVPPKQGMAAIMGRWPGDETEEEIAAALEELP